MSLLPFFNKDSQPPPPPMKSAPKELGPRALCSVECLSWEPGSALGHTMHVYTALRSYLHSWAGSLGSWRGHAPCISCPWTRWQQGPRLARTGPSGKGLEATSSVLGRGATLFFSRVSFVTESSRLVGDLLTLERVMYFSSPKARMTSKGSLGSALWCQRDSPPGSGRNMSCFSPLHLAPTSWPVLRLSAGGQLLPFRKVDVLMWIFVCRNRMEISASSRRNPVLIPGNLALRFPHNSETNQIHSPYCLDLISWTHLHVSLFKSKREYEFRFLCGSWQFSLCS